MTNNHIMFSYSMYCDYRAVGISWFYHWVMETKCTAIVDMGCRNGQKWVGYRTMGPEKLHFLTWWWTPSQIWWTLPSVCFLTPKMHPGILKDIGTNWVFFHPIHPYNYQSKLLLKHCMCRWHVVQVSKVMLFVAFTAINLQRVLNWCMVRLHISFG